MAYLPAIGLTEDQSRQGQHPVSMNGGHVLWFGRIRLLGVTNLRAGQQRLDPGRHPTAQQNQEPLTRADAYWVQSILSEPFILLD